MINKFFISSVQKEFTYERQMLKYLQGDSLYLAHYIERMGTGIQDIIEKCKNYGLPEPKFEMRAGFVAIIYRKKNIAFSKIRNVKDTVKELGMKNLTLIQKAILKEIFANRFITIQALSKKIKINARNTKNNISKLKAMGLLRRIGSDKNGYWEVVNNG